MVNIKRELRTVFVTAKVKPTTKEKMHRRCEELGITMSEYLNGLVLKDLK